MDIQELRDRIDAVDTQLVDLFCQRMRLSAQVAQYKKANHLPIYVPSREQGILADVVKKAGPEMAEYIQALYATVFEQSRSYQSKCMDSSDLK